MAETSSDISDEFLKEIEEVLQETSIEEETRSTKENGVILSYDESGEHAR